MSDPEAHAPAPAVGSPTEEHDAGLSERDKGHDASTPAPRASVAESLADIRADRILGDARREAQRIVDTARVDARREARAIVDAARAEAEGIITEAFEQRARIVRRDWAIGDGDWATASAKDEPGREDDRQDDRKDDRKETGTAAAESAAGAPAPAADMQVPAADMPIRVADPVNGVEDVPRPVPEVVAAATLSELLELPALRARDRFMAAPPRTEPPNQPRPPLPARLRRGTPPPARSSPPTPPPPPPPPAPPARTPPRPRPRIERELPAGMRIPPDVPDWDDDYDDGEGR